MNEAEVSEKLRQLEETDDDSARRSLAMDLSETRDPSVFDALVRLIRRPELMNKRSTFVYCLENYDCSSVVDLLENLVENGNFEVAMWAESILDEQSLRKTVRGIRRRVRSPRARVSRPG